MRNPLLLIVGALAASSLIASAPARACECTSPPLGESLHAAKIAFVGTITKVEHHKFCEPGHEKDDWCTHADTYTVTVDGVWKGKVPAEIEVDSGTGTGDCSTGPLGKHVENQRWLFVGDKLPLKTRMCKGTQLATDGVIASVTKLLGAPAKP